MKNKTAFYKFYKKYINILVKSANFKLNPTSGMHRMWKTEVPGIASANNVSQEDVWNKVLQRSTTAPQLPQATYSQFNEPYLTTMRQRIQELIPKVRNGRYWNADEIYGEALHAGWNARNDVARMRAAENTRQILKPTYRPEQWDVVNQIPTYSTTNIIRNLEDDYHGGYAPSDNMIELRYIHSMPHEMEHAVDYTRARPINSGALKRFDGIDMIADPGEAGAVLPTPASPYAFPENATLEYMGRTVTPAQMMYRGEQIANTVPIRRFKRVFGDNPTKRQQRIMDLIDEKAQQSDAFYKVSLNPEISAKLEKIMDDVTNGTMDPNDVSPEMLQLWRNLYNIDTSKYPAIDRQYIKDINAEAKYRKIATDKILGLAPINKDNTGKRITIADMIREEGTAAGLSEQEIDGILNAISRYKAQRRRWAKKDNFSLEDVADIYGYKTE